MLHHPACRPTAGGSAVGRIVHGAQSLRHVRAAIPTWRSSAAAFLWLQRHHYTIPATEPLTSRGKPLLSLSYVDVQEACESQEGRPVHQRRMTFPVKDEERGLHDHGVSPEAKDYIAKAEEEYRASFAYLHSNPGGASLPEVTTRFDAVTGEPIQVRRIAAPVGETFVPSDQERRAHRGQVGQLSLERETGKIYALNEDAQLNLRKERQLAELVASPMPPLEKVKEVAHTLQSFYSQSFALQPRTAETVMLLFSQVSLQLRLGGRSSAEPPLPRAISAGNASYPSQRHLAGGSVRWTVPFLDDMRQLYSHQKGCFVAPTALTMEHLMVTVSAVTVPSRNLCHLAHRILLDCDRYVVLPTRSTYAAYFSICRVNDAMPLAVARLKDAVQDLGVSIDAAMAVEILKGLNEGGFVEEALALLARLERVPMTTPLLATSLEILLLSKQPLACFSTFDAMRSAKLRLSADIYTLLLLACEQSGQWGRVTFILADMQRRRIKGNTACLNLLLKGLRQERLNEYAQQLYKTMIAKKVEVWPALEVGLRKEKQAPARDDSSRQH